MLFNYYIHSPTYPAAFPALQSHVTEETVATKGHAQAKTPFTAHQPTETRIRDSLGWEAGDRETEKGGRSSQVRRLAPNCLRPTGSQPQTNIIWGIKNNNIIRLSNYIHLGSSWALGSFKCPSGEPDVQPSSRRTAGRPRKIKTRWVTGAHLHKENGAVPG